jgi:hypothetical protein
MHAGDNLDESGLASAVVPEQTENFPTPNLEIDAFERVDATKMLGDVFQAQKHPAGRVLPFGDLGHGANLQTA